MQSSVFPIHLRPEYRDSNAAFDKFESEAKRASGVAAEQFKTDFNEVGSIVRSALKSGLTSSGGIDIDTSGLREAAAQAKFTQQALEDTLRSATALAAETGDNSNKTRLYIKALEAQAVAARKVTQQAQSQVTTYERLKIATNFTASNNSRLAQSYRELFTEQARAARLETNRDRAQEFFNTALGIDQTTKSAKQSAAAFQQMFAATEKAAAAQKKMESSAAQLRAELDPMYAAQQRFDQELARADRLLDAGAISTREYAQAQQLARNNLNATARALTSTTNAQTNAARVGTTANRAVTNSYRAQRFAMVQVGQQLQDVSIQMQTNTRLSTIFVQQGSQLAFAMSGLGGKIGSVARILAGPWGAAVFGAVTALSLFSAANEDADKATDKNKKTQRDFITVLQDSKASYKELTEAAREYADQQEQSEQKTLRQIELTTTLIAKRLKEALAIREQLQAELDRERSSPSPIGPDGAGIEAVAFRLNDLLERSQRNQEKLKTLTDAANASFLTTADRLSELNSDPTEKIREGFNLLRESARDTIKDFDKLTARLTELNRAETAALKAERQRNRKDRKERTPAGETVRFISAVDGRVGSGFGNRRDPITGQTRFHAGIDIPAARGTQVRAPADGVVIQTGTVRGYGKVVFIDHGAGAITRLAHLSRNNQFAAGQRVTQGDIVGNVGSTGRSTGNHLHQELRIRGRPVDPRNRRVAIDPAGVQRVQERLAAAATRETERLARVSDQSANAIARINSQFDDQPRLVDRSAAAVRRLDAIVKELSNPKNADTPRIKQLIEEATDARLLAENAISDAIERQNRDADQSLEIQKLILEGREEEAEIMRRLLRAEQQFGLEARIQDLTDQLQLQRDIMDAAEQGSDEYKAAASAAGDIGDELRTNIDLQKEVVDGIVFQVGAERDVNEQLRIRQQQISQYTGALSTARSEILQFLSGDGDILKGFDDLRKQLQSQNLFENLFGDSFRAIDKRIRENSPLGRAENRLEESMNKTGDNADDLAQDFLDASSVIKQAIETLKGETPGGNSETPSAANDNGNKPIEVIGVRRPIDLSTLSLSEFQKAIAEGIAFPILEELDELLGTRFFSGLRDVLAGTIEGFLRAGPVGAALGGLKGVADKVAEAAEAGSKTAQTASAVSAVLAKALGGAETGIQVDQILKAVGIKSSKTGAIIGGALGGAAAGPIGEIVGSIIGGLVGGFLKKTPRGSAVITGVDTASISGNKSGIRENLTGLSGSVQDALSAIADRLDADLGNFAVSIGQRKDYFRVSASGSRSVGDKNFPSRAGSDLLYDGTDEAEAVRIAVLNAIQDGALQGIREGAQRLLQNAKDIEEGLEKALKFQGVFDELKQRRDPLGFALENLNKDFQDLIDIFREAGASVQEFADLEELYELRRAEAIEQATEQFTSSLRGLLNDLTIGDNGLSLRDRLTNALAEFNPLAASVRAGDRVDYDKFEEAARAVLELERQIFGSQVNYFSRFNEITDLTRQALDREQGLINGGTDVPNIFDDPANDNLGVVTSIDAMNDNLAAYLAAINQNLIGLRGGNVGGLRLADPSNILAF